MMGLAAMAASEAYGACRVNAGIVGRLDLKDPETILGHRGA